MNAYERLEDEACGEGIDVVNYCFTSNRIKGLYCDGVVAINKDLKTTIQKANVLAEELGHHYTTVGDIIDQSSADNRRQELRARLWAYNKQIGLSGIIQAYEHGCRTWYETADFLEVTEEFLKETIECYRSKYGTHAKVDNYIITFMPTLGVMKMI